MWGPTYDLSLSPLPPLPPLPIKTLHVIEYKQDTPQVSTTLHTIQPATSRHHKGEKREKEAKQTDEDVSF